MICVFGEGGFFNQSDILREKETPSLLPRMLSVTNETRPLQKHGYLAIRPLKIGSEKEA